MAAFLLSSWLGSGISAIRLNKKADNLEVTDYKMVNKTIKIPRLSNISGILKVNWVRVNSWLVS